MPPSFVITPVIPDFSELTAQLCSDWDQGMSLLCLTDSTVLCLVCTTTTTYFISLCIQDLIL